MTDSNQASMPFQGTSNLFGGRLNRASFMGGSALLLVAFPLVMSVFESNEVIATIATLLFIIGMASLSIRRFHDVGSSGWYFIFCLVVPVIAFIYLCIEKSQKEKNEWGDSVLGASFIDAILGRVKRVELSDAVEKVKG